MRASDRRLVAVAILLAGLVPGCQETAVDLTQSELSTMEATNAENEVRSLLVRYHEARHRVSEYEPLVVQEEARLQAMLDETRTLRLEVAQAFKVRDAAAAQKASLDKEAAELKALIDALTARVAAMKAATPELVRKVDELKAQLDAAGK